MQKVPTYVATPYGFAESTRIWYYQTLLPMLEKYVEVLDPWKEAILQPDAEFSALDRAVHLGTKHLTNIKNNARLLVAGLDQEPPDCGTVAEVAWAAAHNIPVIAYRNDFRTSGEEGVKYNLMIASIVKYSGGVEVSNLLELEEQVEHYSAKM